MRTIIVAAAAALSLSACAGGGGRSALATTYGKMHLFGGYDDEEIEPGVWKVTGAGNGPAGPGFGRNVAVYRAAELVRSRGFSHVQILKQKGKSQSVGVRGGSMSYAGERMVMTVRGTNDPAAPLACRDKNPQACMTVGVDRIIATIGPQLNFRNGRTQ